MIHDFDGSVVETMIRDGRRIVDDAVARYHPIAIFAAFSGGNDSIVTAHWAASEFDATVLHCETGVGLYQIKMHVLDCARRFGWELVVEPAAPEGRTETMTDDQLPRDGWIDGCTAYEEYVLNFGFPGPGQHPRMYQRLKERSIRRYTRKLKEGTPRGSKVLVISGIRGDESAVRAGYKRSCMVNGAEVWVNPFYWRSAFDFGAYRQEFGLPRNPVKDKIGISGECCCGAFANTESERVSYRIVEPEFAEYLDDLERRVQARGFPWGWGQRCPKWWMDAKRGQKFMFDMDKNGFMPMCVGCSRRS